MLLTPGFGLGYKNSQNEKYSFPFIFGCFLLLFSRSSIIP